MGDREVSLGRELTKKHEQLVKGPISFILNNLTTLKGEMTLVVSPESDRNIYRMPADKILIYNEFCHLTDDKGLGRREAISKLARRHDLSSKDVYTAIEAAKE